MSEATESTVVSTPKSADPLPDVLTEFEFELFMELAQQVGDEAAKLLFDGARQRFGEQNPLLAELYELEFEEFDVRYGSRNSRVRARIRKRRRREEKRRESLWTRAKRAIGTGVMVLGVLSTDPEQVRENVETAIEWTMGVMGENGLPLAIRYDDGRIVQPMEDRTGSPRPGREDAE